MRPCSSCARFATTTRRPYGSCITWSQRYRRARRSRPWEDDLRDICATYLDSGGDFLVGLLDDELVAIGGLLRRSSDEAEIRRMRVHPDRQRCGFGRLLLERLEERARALGCRAIRLDSTEQQTAAQRLYESAGYRETGRRQTTRFRFIDYAKTRDPR